MPFPWTKAVNLEEYHKMHALEREYWWFQGRRRVILGTLEQFGVKEGANLQLLDVGCGTGMLMDDLRRCGRTAGLDFSQVALAYCRQRNLENLGKADARHLPVKTSSVDVITALDLVEHISDDRGLLGEFQRVLKPGGIAVMSVPAHKGLWSNHDVALHHYRRYEKDEFRKLVEGAGLIPEKYTYAMATAYLPALVFRSVKRVVTSNSGASPTTDEFRLPGWLNSALRKAVSLEARLLSRLNLPFGLSLLTVARKPLLH